MRLVAMSCNSVSRLVAAVVIATSIGCGSGLATVKGTVTIDGEKIVKTEKIRCKVTLTPSSGIGANASGAIDESGVFTLSTGAKKGVAPGEYLGSVYVKEVIPPKEQGGYSISKRISPKQFSNPSTSGITYTVKSRGNSLDIDINTSQ